MDAESEQKEKEVELEQGVTFEVVEKGMEDGRRVSRRGVYLLPNLFTTGALFCGFYAIVASINGLFEKSALALFLAAILDSLDGRVARLTHTQSDFGAEYDSLSDLVAFGVAPALMVYTWSLSGIGKIGWMASFFFMACAALRLARFNSQIPSQDKRFFVGLPSPSAAGLLVTFVWVGFDMGWDGQVLAGWVILLTVFAACLMVSNLPYYSFKEIDYKGRVPFVAILVVVLLFVVVFLDPPKVLLLMSLTYACSGVVVYIKGKMYHVTFSK